MPLSMMFVYKEVWGKIIPINRLSSSLDVCIRALAQLLLFASLHTLNSAGEREIFILGLLYLPQRQFLGHNLE